MLINWEEYVSGFLVLFMLPIQPLCLSKVELLTLLDDQHLTLTQVRGQGYDGAYVMLINWEEYVSG
jgi:hypothetical protein